MIPALSMAYSLWRGQSLTEKLRNAPVRRGQKAALCSCVWLALQGDALIFNLSGLAVVYPGQSSSRADYGESLSLGTLTALWEEGNEEL